MRRWIGKAAFLLVLPVSLRASASDYTVRISGTAKGAEGREIVWRADADPFSMRYVELDRCRIDENGAFVLQTDLVADVLPTYLVIDYYATVFFARAGSDYRLRMAPFDYHADETRNAFVPSDQLPSLQYVLLDEDGRPDTVGLNALLGRYSRLYDRMVARNFEQIGIRKDSRPVTRFIQVADSVFGDVDDAYFKAYRLYTEAALEEFSGLSSRKELYERYLKDRPLAEENPAWAAFVKSYYTDYFQTNRFLPFSQVARILNRKDLTAGERLACLADSMGLDYSLKGERLRERVLIGACAEVRGDERVDEENLLEMLRFLAVNTKFPGHAKALENLLRAVREAEERRYFTEVELADSAGNEIPVGNLLEKDKFHYFVFVRADYERCPSCREEADLLEKIWNAASEDVRRAVKIVFVNCDYPFAAYYHDFMRRRYPWPYLHFNGNIDWVRTVDAARFPAFVLVDDTGRVLDASFNAPGNGLPDAFEKMGRLRIRKERSRSGSKD